MPNWLLPILIVLAIAAVRFEIRVERGVRSRQESEADAVRRQIEREGGRF